MNKELTEKQIKIIANNSHLSEDKVKHSFDLFKKYNNENKGLDLHNFTEFFKLFLPKKGNSNDFCKLIFKGKYKFIQR
jgi:hypothetical protein